jgi:hexosaminidase
VNGKLHDLNHHFNRSVTDGTFTAKLGGKVAKYTCKKPIACKIFTPVPPAKENSSRPFIWPIPREYSNGSSTFVVTPSSGFFSLKQTSALLTTAIKRYDMITFPHAVSPSMHTTRAEQEQLSILHITVDSTAEEAPQLATNESYALTIDSDSAGGAKLHAATVYGVLRGLETFSQLVRFSFNAAEYTIKGSPWKIVDSPRFQHRGLMVDTARHFLPVKALKSMIDSLAYAKLNVLHWHMSDTQSFPLELHNVPDLWAGAFSPQERFSQSDVVGVVEYARLRGVRVLVEFDMPGVLPPLALCCLLVSRIVRMLMLAHPLFTHIFSCPLCRPCRILV